YSTRVGSGPFPSELNDETGATIRERGKEYGVSTGRARRCGWFDAVAARYAVRINGIELIAVTLLDVLDAFDEIPIAVGYRLKGGQVIREFPADTASLEGATAEYVVAKGWKSELSAARCFDDLPPAAKDYLRRLE